MWTSVPQIDEIFTRMSTSSAVGSGTGTSITSVLFGAGFSLTAAFILAGMVNPPQIGAQKRGCGGGVSTFCWDRFRGEPHARMGWSLLVRYPITTKRYSFLANSWS